MDQRVRSSSEDTLAEPIPGPTALMLLALQGHRAEPRVAAAVGYLCDQLADCRDLEHLAWGRLALDLHRDEPDVASVLPQLDIRIREAHAERAAVPWLRPSPPFALPLPLPPHNRAPAGAESPPARCCTSYLSPNPLQRPPPHSGELGQEVRAPTLAHPASRRCLPQSRVAAIVRWLREPAR